MVFRFSFFSEKFWWFFGDLRSSIDNYIDPGVTNVRIPGGWVNFFSKKHMAYGCFYFFVVVFVVVVVVVVVLRKNLILKGCQVVFNLTTGSWYKGIQFGFRMDKCRQLFTTGILHLLPCCIIVFYYCTRHSGARLRATMVFPVPCSEKKTGCWRTPPNTDENFAKSLW